MDSQQPPQLQYPPTRHLEASFLNLIVGMFDLLIVIYILARVLPAVDHAAEKSAQLLQLSVDNHTQVIENHKQIKTMAEELHKVMEIRNENKPLKQYMDANKETQFLLRRLREDIKSLQLKMEKKE
jgi:hypothetical protein